MRPHEKGPLPYEIDSNNVLRAFVHEDRSLLTKQETTFLETNFGKNFFSALVRTPSFRRLNSLKNRYGRKLVELTERALTEPHEEKELRTFINEYQKTSRTLELKLTKLFGAFRDSPRSVRKFNARHGGFFSQLVERSFVSNLELAERVADTVEKNIKVLNTATVPSYDARKVSRSMLLLDQIASLAYHPKGDTMLTRIHDFPIQSSLNKEEREKLSARLLAVHSRFRLHKIEE